MPLSKAIWKQYASSPPAHRLFSKNWIARCGFRNFNLLHPPKVYTAPIKMPFKARQSAAHQCSRKRYVGFAAATCHTPSIGVPRVRRGFLAPVCQDCARTALVRRTGNRVLVNLRQWMHAFHARRSVQRAELLMPTLYSAHCCSFRCKYRDLVGSR